MKYTEFQIQKDQVGKIFILVYTKLESELINHFNEKFTKEYKYEKNYYENLMRTHFFMQMLFGRIAFNILRKEKQGIVNRNLSKRYKR